MLTSVAPAVGIFIEPNTTLNHTLPAQIRPKECLRQRVIRSSFGPYLGGGCMANAVIGLCEIWQAGLSLENRKAQYLESPRRLPVLLWFCMHDKQQEWLQVVSVSLGTSCFALAAFLADPLDQTHMMTGFQASIALQTCRKYAN